VLPKTEEATLVLSAKLGQSEWPLASKQKQMNVSAIPSIGEYYEEKQDGISNLPKRIEQLRTVARPRNPGTSIPTCSFSGGISHRSREAQRQVAVLLVHEFISPGLSFRKLKQNADDWDTICSEVRSRSENQKQSLTMCSALV
jgi:hypothetical protein